MWVRRSWTMVVSVSLLVLVGGVRAQEAPQKAPAKEYARSEAMVPMRDGVKLHVVILRPAGSESAGEPSGRQQLISSSRIGAHQYIDQRRCVSSAS